MASETVKQNPAGDYLPGSRRKFPAWAMSVALHLAAFLLCAFFFGAESRPLGVVHQERRAEIVLVPAQSAVRQADWLEEGDSDQSKVESAATLQTQPAMSGSASESLTEEALPSGVQPPIPATVELPKLAGSASPGNPLAALPNKLGGRGRPVLLPGVHEAEILAQEAARPKEAPVIGTPARLSVFGAGATGRSFVFVIDRSESMGGSRLGAIDAAAKELSISLAALSDEQYFQVVSYNEAATIHARRELMPATAANKHELISFVENLSAFGGTEHTYGLLAALKFRPEVVYLFTDGGDPAPDSLQLRTIRDAAADRTQIHCLHFGSGTVAATGAEFLRRIASENRGTYTYIDVRGR